MQERWDILIIGAGPGGYVAALKAAQEGARVAVVEKEHLGGTCLNRGCIPSKALLASAELFHHIQQAQNWGIKVPAGVSFDWSAIQKHKDTVIARLRNGIAGLFRSKKVQLFQGTASLEGPGKVRVRTDGDQGQLLEAEHVILASGSVPVQLPGWPTDPTVVCTSDQAVHWPDLPRRLLIVGGGVIGCEFACLTAALGVQVYVVEMMDRLLPTLDADLGRALQEIFQGRGIQIYCQTKVEDLRLKEGEKPLVQARLSNGQELEVDRVLVSVGRRANTQGLNLDRAGVVSSPRGFVAVNEYLQTNVPGIWAIGDLNGRWMLAHAASAQGEVAVENILGRRRAFDMVIPSAVYTFPEIGSVGMSEAEAREAGLPISVGRYPLGHLGKAMAARCTEGFVKVIRHREDQRILGLHMLGAHATECIAAAAVLMHTRASTQDLAEAALAHPTISEALKEAAGDALGRAIHLPPRKVLRVTVEV